MVERRLILMRHAQAESTRAGLTDRARPLTPHGEVQAACVAQQLVERGWLPHAALCSDAARTRETWQAVAAILGARAPQPVLLRALYLGEPRDVTEALAELDDAIRCALVLGHNPGISDTVSWLSDVYAALAPAHAALLESRAEHWAGALEWRLVEVLRP